MISAVIATLNDARRLTATLAALAPAAMDGFVRQVIVADGGSTDDTVAVAEDAGADVVTTGLPDAIAAARQPWLLILEPGARPEVGWERAALAHMRDYPDKAGWFDLALPEPGVAARMSECLARVESVVLGRPRSYRLLVCSQRIKSAVAAANLNELVRVIGQSRLRRLGARVLVMR